MKQTHSKTIDQIFIAGSLVLMPFLFIRAFGEVVTVRTVGIGLLCVLFLLVQLFRKTQLLAAVPLLVRVALWLFIFFGAVGFVAAINQFEVLLHSGHWMIFACFFILLAHLFHKDEHLLLFGLKCLTITALAQIAFGLLQLADVDLFRYDPDQIHATGTLVNPNMYGAAMLFLLCANAAGIAWLRGIWRIFAAGAMGGSLFMVLYADSAAVKLGLGLVLALAGFIFVGEWLRRKYPSKRPAWAGFKVRIVVFGLLLAGAGVGGYTWWSQTQRPLTNTLTGTSSSELERIQLWKASAEITSESPAMGVGAGNWKFHILRKGIVSKSQGFATRYFVRAHNDFVQAFAERGIPGGLALLAFFVLLFVRGFKILEGNYESKYRFLAAAALCGLGAWVTIASFSFPSERPFNFTLGLTFGALICAVPTEKPVGKLFRDSTLTLLMLAVISLILMVFRLSVSSLNHQLMLAKDRQNWPAVARMADEADRWYNRTEHISFTPISWYRGTALLQMQRPAEALPALEMARIVHPWHPHVLSNLGTAQFGNGQLDSALETYETLIGTFPDWDQARMNLSELYLTKGNLNGALQNLDYWEKHKFDLAIAKYVEHLRAVLDSVGRDNIR